MSLETTAILRSVLYNAEMAETLEDVIHAIKVMCSKEDITVVEREVAETKKDREERAAK